MMELLCSAVQVDAVGSGSLSNPNPILQRRDPGRLLPVANL